MFGMGMNEILIVLVIAVIVIGPKQLPQVARTMGKMMAQFKRATNDMRNTISDEVNTHIPMDEINEMRDSLENGVRDLHTQSRSLVESEFDDDKKIGQAVADDLRSAMNDMPTGELDYAPGNGGEPRKKPRKSTAAKSDRKKTKAMAANGGVPAKKAASAKHAGKTKVAATRVAAAKSVAVKSTGKGGEKLRQGGRA